MRISRTPLIVISLLLVCLAILAYLLHSPYEITRLRNSLITTPGAPADFNWLPGSPPADYSIETMAPPPAIKEVVDRLSFGDTVTSELSRALDIAQHMHGADRSTGSAIQSNFSDAYQQIVEQNNGYCSDFTQVFNGLAMAANIPVREWGMSFDGFSGNGHAFSEIYDNELQQWVFIDSFYSFYVIDTATQRPLSVLELREQLEQGQISSLGEGVRPISAQTFAFKSGQKAMQYYADGVSEYFLWFGTDVFSYDSNQLVKLASNLGRSAEQAVAILLGEHPDIRVYQVAETQPSLRRLNWTRRLFVLAVMSGVMAVGIAIITWRRRSRV